jgi:hypothetical protein
MIMKRDMTPVDPVSGKRSITADTALRLARFFGTDAQSKMNMQTHINRHPLSQQPEPLLLAPVVADPGNSRVVPLDPEFIIHPGWV